MSRRVLLLAVTIAVVAGCTQTNTPNTPNIPTTTTVTTAMVAGRPWPTVTPGVTLQATAEQVCQPGWASAHRQSLTALEKGWVLGAYGYPPGQKVAEYDHLESLELGGSNGVRNIWPQVNEADAKRKDRLEGALHKLVCSGKLSLAAAQERIRRYWTDPLY